jgi:hypothetical protein
MRKKIVKSKKKGKIRNKGAPKKKTGDLREMISVPQKNKGGGNTKYDFRPLYQLYVYNMGASVSIRALSEDYHIPLTTLTKHAAKHKWGEARKEFQEDVDKQIREQAVGDAALVKLLNIESSANAAEIILADLRQAKATGGMSRSGLKDMMVSLKMNVQTMALLSGEPTQRIETLNPFERMNEKEGKAIGDDFRDAGKPLKIKMLSDLKKLKRKRSKK